MQAKDDSREDHKPDAEEVDVISVSLQSVGDVACSHPVHFVESIIRRSSLSGNLAFKDVRLILFEG